MTISVTRQTGRWVHLVCADGRQALLITDDPDESIVIPDSRNPGQTLEFTLGATERNRLGDPVARQTGADQPLRTFPDRIDVPAGPLVCLLCNETLVYRFSDYFGWQGMEEISKASGTEQLAWRSVLSCPNCTQPYHWMPGWPQPTPVQA